jgi:cytoskeletal protein RodZ
MDIGAELRNARKARELSIEEISRVTKISPSVLRAIEHDDFDRVPGGLFTRGFLRSYAREIGLDPEEIVQEYRAQFEIPEMPVSEGRTEATAATDELHVGPYVDDEPAGSRHSQIIQVGIILIVLLVYFASWQHSQPSANTDLQPATTIGVSTPAEVPVAMAGSIDSADRPRSELKVEIHPQGECWVQATADGERVVARLMMAGEQQTIDAREDLTLRVGDPGAFAFSINGTPGRSLGRAGAAVTVQINRGNYTTFLERAGT